MNIQYCDTVSENGGLVSHKLKKKTISDVSIYTDCQFQVTDHVTGLVLSRIQLHNSKHNRRRQTGGESERNRR